MWSLPERRSDVEDVVVIVVVRSYTLWIRQCIAQVHSSWYGQGREETAAPRDDDFLTQRLPGRELHTSRISHLLVGNEPAGQDKASGQGVARGDFNRIGYATAVATACRSDQPGEVTYL